MPWWSSGPKRIEPVRRLRGRGRRRSGNGLATARLMNWPRLPLRGTQTPAEWKWLPPLRTSRRRRLSDSLSRLRLAWRGAPTSLAAGSRGHASLWSKARRTRPYTVAERRLEVQEVQSARSHQSFPAHLPCGTVQGVVRRPCTRVPLPEVVQGRGMVRAVRGVRSGKSRRVGQGVPRASDDRGVGPEAPPPAEWARPRI